MSVWLAFTRDEREKFPISDNTQVELKKQKVHFYWFSLSSYYLNVYSCMQDLRQLIKSHRFNDQLNQIDVCLRNVKNIVFAINKHILVNWNTKRKVEITAAARWIDSIYPIL